MLPKSINDRYPRTLWNMLPMPRQCFTQQSIPTDTVKHMLPMLQQCFTQQSIPTDKVKHVTYVAAMLHWTIYTPGHCETCYLCHSNVLLNDPYPRTLWNTLPKSQHCFTHRSIPTGHCETSYLCRSNASLNNRYPRTLWNHHPGFLGWMFNLK